MKGKGWEKESARHALAARGLATKLKQVERLKSVEIGSMARARNALKSLEARSEKDFKLIKEGAKMIDEFENIADDQFDVLSKKDKERYDNLDMFVGQLLDEYVIELATIQEMAKYQEYRKAKTGFSDVAKRAQKLLNKLESAVGDYRFDDAYDDIHNDFQH